MDNASLKRQQSSSLSRSPSPSPASSSLSSSRTSTRPSTSSLVRPAPARKGQPASSRNFSQSSAGGATSHLSATAGQQSIRDDSIEKGKHHDGTGLNQEQLNKVENWGQSYIPSEETIRNDYSGEYVESGKRPQNFIRNANVETRFQEYPKLASLLSLKHDFTSSTQFSIPPTYINPTALAPLPSATASSPPPPLSGTSLALSHLINASSRFDSILLTPPPSLSFSSLSSLAISSVASNPGFIWLWVGSGQKLFDSETGELKGTDGIGLEKGRELLSRWGYRRCEDIVWLKSNRKNPEQDLTREPTSLFTPTVEHCLMGIRGTVRRSTDSWFVHCNVDTDVIIWEGDDQDPALKPPELQSLIENFCLGTRRLHLFGSENALRRGWLTVACSNSETEQDGDEEITYSKESKVQSVEKEEQDGNPESGTTRWEPREWNREDWRSIWQGNGEGKVQPLLPYNEELDSLRPKSPPPRNGQPSSGGLGRGRGAGLGITRSGLVTQAVPRGPSQSSMTPNGNGMMNGIGRGRGRGNGIAPIHHPATNGFSPAASTSSAYPTSSRTPSSTSSANGSPYRTHSIAPPNPSTVHHPLPSRPAFTPQRSSSNGHSHSTHPSQYRNVSAPTFLAPPVGASPSRHQAQGYPNSPFALPHSPTYHPSLDPSYYAHQSQSNHQQHFIPQNFAAPPPPHQLSHQFSNLSLSQSQTQFHLHQQQSAMYPISSHPPPLHHSIGSFNSSSAAPSPAISPAISPALSHMTLPPYHPHPYQQYTFPQPGHPIPPPSLSSSSSSSSIMRFGYRGDSGGQDEGELQYPIGGPGSQGYS